MSNHNPHDYLVWLKALVGFQGRGCADGVQPNCCHPFLLEALLFQWPKKGVVLLGQCLEHKTSESNKNDEDSPPGSLKS